MQTLHILRSPVDADVAELVEAVRSGEEPVSLVEGDTDYDELLRLVFAADRVICWW